MPLPDPKLLSQLNEPDAQVDPVLRPRTLEEFIGQIRIKEQLRIAMEAARLRGENLDHVLFCGPPGLGKTTLAHLLANHMQCDIKTASGPMLDRPGDLAGLLTSLGKGDIFFIDEIHRLNPVVEEYLYSAMEDHWIDILIDRGAHARSVRLELQPFTLAGATTRSGLLSRALRSRFGMIFHLDYYGTPDLQLILKRSAGVLAVALDDEAGWDIGRRSRGTARIANHLLKRVRDYAQVHGYSRITQVVSEKALDLLDVDHRGLDEMDKKILRIIVEHYQGGPVGLNTVAVAVGEESQTIEEVHEPFLILSGLIKRTAQGRMATPAAWKHLGLKLPGQDGDLFTKGT